MRQEMKETSSFLEEAKADISGLFALQYHDRQGRRCRSRWSDRSTRRFLASALPLDPLRHQRSARPRDRDSAEFAARFGWFSVSPDGTFAVNHDRIKDGVTALTREIMTIQADGDYAKAKALGERLGTVRPQVQRALDKLAAVPVDIEPRFITAEQLLQPAQSVATRARSVSADEPDFAGVSWLAFRFLSVIVACNVAIGNRALGSWGTRSSGGPLPSR